MGFNHMYIPEYFKIEDKETIYDYIKKYSFATLFSQHNGKPYATHLPLLMNKDEHALYGHIARANKQWQDWIDQQILVVFQGPHCYISPSYYETNKAVPTWDYVSIHVYGKIELINEKNRVLNFLNDLVNKYEKSDSPYNYQDLDPVSIEEMMKELVAFKLTITNIEAQAKLSQNQSIERQEFIIKHLESSDEQNDRQVADLMRKNLINE